MLIWLDGAPAFEDVMCESTEQADELKQAVCDFVDKVISYDRKWDGSPHHDIETKSNHKTWKELIKRQTHRHTSTCKRKRGGNDIVCRFNIPFPPMESTMILVSLYPSKYSVEVIKHFKALNQKIRNYLNENLKTLAESDMTFYQFLEKVIIPSAIEYVHALRSVLKMNKIYIKRNPKEIMINNFNKKIISMFRSNMDIQFILDPYACCCYVVDYINKADRDMSKTIEEIYAKFKEDPSKNSLDVLKSLAAAYYIHNGKFWPRFFFLKTNVEKLQPSGKKKFNFSIVLNFFYNLVQLFYSRLQLFYIYSERSSSIHPPFAYTLILNSFIT